MKKTITYTLDGSVDREIIEGTPEEILEYELSSAFAEAELTNGEPEEEFCSCGEPMCNMPPCNEPIPLATPPQPWTSKGLGDPYFDTASISGTATGPVGTNKDWLEGDQTPVPNRGCTLSLTSQGLLVSTEDLERLKYQTVIKPY